MARQKTKLLLIGTRELKQKRAQNLNLSLTVNNVTVTNTRSECLLGLTINCDMTWSEYLHGEKWRQNENKNKPGLIGELKKRVGMIRKLSNPP